jgi:tRNA-Thr(GGU) m(6)t(6)A37 methyltransferase TsaA
MSNVNRDRIQEKKLNQQGENLAPIALKPIARVKNDVEEIGIRCWKDVVSEIVFEPGFEDALDSIDSFSHIIVIFWMHRSPAWDNSMSKTHPQRRQDLPLVGIFATRSPVRPNPLGIATVRLLERKGNVLKVAGLDAVNNTPVMDIKTYFPGDSIADIKVPDWVYKLRQYKAE